MGDVHADARGGGSVMGDEHADVRGGGGVMGDVWI